MIRNAKASRIRGPEGFQKISQFRRRDVQSLPHRPSSSIPKQQIATIDRLLARALVYTVLGMETDDLIALARSLANSQEQRAA